MTDYWTLITIMFLAMMSPGPDLILILNNGRFGIKTGLATSLGITVGFGLHTTLVVFGLSLLLTQNIILKQVVSILGAFYLTHIAIKIWNSYKEELLLNGKKLKNWRESFKEGFVCNILNPKVLLFILSLFTQFIPIEVSLNTKLKLAFILIMECLIVWSLFGIFLQYRPLKELMINKRKYIDRLFAFALILFSGKIFFTAFQSFFNHR